MAKYIEYIWMFYVKVDTLEINLDSFYALLLDELAFEFNYHWLKNYLLYFIHLKTKDITSFVTYNYFN